MSGLEVVENQEQFVAVMQVSLTPREYVSDVTSVRQRPSPWPCSSVKVKIKFPLECWLRFTCAPFDVRGFYSKLRIQGQLDSSSGHCSSPRLCQEIQYLALILTDKLVHCVSCAQGKQIAPEVKFYGDSFRWPWRRTLTNWTKWSQFQILHRRVQPSVGTDLTPLFLFSCRRSASRSCSRTSPSSNRTWRLWRTSIPNASSTRRYVVGDSFELHYIPVQSLIDLK